MSPAVFLSWSVDIGLVLIVLAIALCVLRLGRGPTLADRVVALDLMTVAIIAFAALFALRTGVAAWLDIAMTLALVGFVPVVALARYAARQSGRLSRRSDRNG